MAVDLQINLQTGDLQLSAILDLAIAQGENVTQQRVHTRCVIARGSFIYDTTGELGSLLSTLLSKGVPAVAAAVQSAVMDALEPMDDISVISVDVFVYGDGSGRVTDPRQCLAEISYQSNTAPTDYASITSVTIALPIQV
jgi:hypothetical protein